MREFFLDDLLDSDSLTLVDGTEATISDSVGWKANALASKIECAKYLSQFSKEQQALAVALVDSLKRKGASLLIFVAGLSDITALQSVSTVALA